MARAFSIGAARHIDLIKDKLGRELKLFEGSGLKVKLVEQPAGKFTFLNCRLVDYGGCLYPDEDARTILKNHLAGIIADIILEYWEDHLVREIIRENYYYFAEEEKDMIFRYTLQHINREKDGSSSGQICLVIRKSRILQKVLEYMHGNNRIILDGFIKFRLKEYINELREAADSAVDDFLIEREYREFIQLLKYFVGIQEPRYEQIHVLIKPEKYFVLYDEKHRVIKRDCLEGCIIELSDNEISYDDLLVSVLITLSPRWITIHYEGDCGVPAAIDTIVNVFEERVTRCGGCKLCNPGLKH